MPDETISHFRILDKLGEGGMGEVYRAHDPRLNRDVAIKVLPPHRLESAEARARFEREAKAVAALSHPNILAIHDVGQQDDQVFLVMELLEGRSLRERLNESPVPVRRALDIAAQVADGLAAAHEKGIVHRDIKPANLFLTPDGRVKILDFGLAKAQIPQGSATIADTVSEETEPGRVMGTARYMSPEQARGQALDHRSDIFSLGAVLWEMLAGRPPFDGDSAVEVMNSILKMDPPDLTSASDQVPPAVDRIVRRCLEKSAERRFQSAQDLAFALRNSPQSSSHSLPAVEVSTRSSARSLRWFAVALALLVVGAAMGAFVATRTRSPQLVEPAKIVQFTQSGRDWGPSASPDGQVVAFTSDRDGKPRVWLRQVKSGVEAPLTDGPDGNPRFAPDGGSILFMRGEAGGLRAAHRVPLVGGAPRRLVDDIWEACWSPDGRRIGFTRGGGTGDDIATEVGVADVQSGETRILTSYPLRFAYGIGWSPDGRWISVSTNTATQNVSGDQSVQLIDVETGATKVAWHGSTQLSSSVWAPDGKSLVLAQSTSLLGDLASPLGRMLRIDPDRGEQRLLFWVQSVWAGSGDYVTIDFLDARTLVFDEILWSGNLTEVSLQAGDASPSMQRVTQGNSRDRQPAYSPDGKQIVFSSNRSGNLDLWVVTRDTGEMRQLTDDAMEDWDPAFSADGKEILWSSNRGGHLEIWRMSASGTNARQITQDGVDAENPTETPDGQWVVYGSANPERNGIWKIPTDGGEEVQIADGSYLLPEISPDGRYVVFCNNDPQLRQVQMHVADLQTGKRVFSTSVPALGLQSMVQPGRARWMPGGMSIAFVATRSDQRPVVLVQDFRLGVDTSASRRTLVQRESDADIESFGIAPDGSAVVVATIRQFRTIQLADVPALAAR